MSTIMYLDAVKITILLAGVVFIAACVFNGVKKLLK